MNKLKVLLTILMGTLIAFAAQRSYYVKTEELSSIYSDIIFTRLAVESQEYTRQIEYGVKNGKSLENFYNISSVFFQNRNDLLMITLVFFQKLG